MEKKILLISMAGLYMAIAVGCGFRNKAESSEYVIETDPVYNIETATLLEKFPITYPTPTSTREEKGIRNRMLNGFNCWNEGFDAWKNWGDVLYSPESIYNVNGVRMTLEEYQQSMNITLARTDIQMGDFDNMIISGNWTANRYQTTHRNRQTSDVSPVPVTEFVRFKDFGDRGMKVDEGWGGTKGGSYDGLMSFLSEEEKVSQKKLMDEIMAIKLPETEDLEEKYPVLYPTEIKGDRAKRMRSLILQDLDNWNQGTEKYSKWVDSFFSENVSYEYNDEVLGRNGIKAKARTLIEEKTLKRVKVYNILVSEDWAAVHSWHVVSGQDGFKDVFNSMAFYHFTGEDSSLVVDKCCIKENS
ncbi:MAG: nuclear transport factor 2 family protein [Bacteroidales bacterium]|nr:nuclear transport factor 2 family protein [Bacteroidales bacterium]